MKRSSSHAKIPMPYTKCMCVWARPMRMCRKYLMNFLLKFLSFPSISQGTLSFRILFFLLRHLLLLLPSFVFRLFAVGCLRMNACERTTESVYALFLFICVRLSFRLWLLLFLFQKPLALPHICWKCWKISPKMTNFWYNKPS